MAQKEKNIVYIECHCCGEKTPRTSPNRKYCSRCAEKIAKSPTRKRRSKSAERLLDWRDLRGKSLNRVDAEAKAFGLSYGQYTAAVYSGGIDALLRSRGFIDPKAVLMGVKAR